ncbi:ACT domain-containing protein [Flavobacterium sp. Arc3]|uniref:ACT domain-containing protein n=1 Tax=Flavobacterium sp. Arc3 TaxID=3046686 RepID=UPI00352FA5F4
MAGEKDLETLLKTMKPKHIEGDYVFCVINSLESIDLNVIVMLFKEEEATTIILKKECADSSNLEYTSVMAWITLTVHSSLEAVGLTAAFSNALSQEEISCNVVAGYYHDHIFVDQKDINKAMEILNSFSK